MEWKHTREVGTHRERGYKTYTEKENIWRGNIYGKGI